MNQTLPILIRREHKDRLFKFIFGQENEKSKKWRLLLYNALNDTNYTDPNALQINTIENVLYITMRNDISFLLDSEINLYEEQSTKNPNMPLRGFLYFAILYQSYLKQNKKNLISDQLIKIPTPKFIVFYTGSDNSPDTWNMRLSDAFLIENKTGDFEWTAKIINIHPNHNKTLQNNCKPLYDYISFIAQIKRNRKNGLDNNTAIEQAVDWAIKEDLLEGFFKENRSQVIGSCLTEFDEEEYKRICYEDGVYEKAIKDAVILVKDFKATPELAAQKMNAPLEKVLEALENS